MTQWTPDQPPTHPDHPPAPISGGVEVDMEMSQIITAEVLTLVAAERRRQIDIHGWTRSKDAHRDPADWCGLIQQRLQEIDDLEFRSDEGLPDTEKMKRQSLYFKAMVQIAALACAAIESVK